MSVVCIPPTIYIYSVCVSVYVFNFDISIWYIYIYIYIVCVCVCEREREREMNSIKIINNNVQCTSGVQVSELRSCIVAILFSAECSVLLKFWCILWVINKWCFDFSFLFVVVVVVARRLCEWCVTIKVGLKVLRCRIDILGTIKVPLPFLC